MNLKIINSTGDWMIFIHYLNLHIHIMLIG